MQTTALNEIHLIGLSLQRKTTNANGQSHTDCKNLWHAFDEGHYIADIPGKISDDVYGVYYEYEGDHTKPFSYFIGCRVKAPVEAPPGMQSLTIPAGNYKKITVSGAMPDCVTNAWKDIWKGDHARAYATDFEVYDERSIDWNNAEVDVYLSVKE